jgi:hypothetical protein
MKTWQSYVLLILVTAFCTYVLISPQSATLQVSNCPPISALYPYPPKGMWPQGSYVKVNIDPSFTPQQKTAIVGAINSWNASNNYPDNECLVTLGEPTYSPTKLGSSFNSYNLQITNSPNTGAGDCSWEELPRTVLMPKSD